MPAETFNVYLLEPDYDRLVWSGLAKADLPAVMQTCDERGWPFRVERVAGDDRG